MTQRSAKETAPSLELVGMHFHTFDKDERLVVYQGRVTSRAEPGWYVVQFYDWILGFPSRCKLVNIEEMESWNFYDSAASMNDTYERRYGPRSEQHAKKQLENKAGA